MSLNNSLAKIITFHILIILITCVSTSCIQKGDKTNINTQTQKLNNQNTSSNTPASTLNSDNSINKQSDAVYYDETLPISLLDYYQKDLKNEYKLTNFDFNKFKK